MIAAEGGHAEIADLLLARGADPSLKDKAGKRAADLTVLSSLRERLTRPEAFRAFSNEVVTGSRGRKRVKTKD